MIDFLLGVALTLPLIVATIFITQLCNLFKEIILGLAGAMVVLDSIIVLGFTFTVLEFVSNVNVFILGIGMSIMLALIFKIFYMKHSFQWAYNMDYRSDPNAKPN
tara:strand:- start:610 stop:924 length:315 start_codon:yes stop_codon:yes gene_type:complete